MIRREFLNTGRYEADLLALSEQTEITVSEHIRRALEQYAPLRGRVLSGAEIMAVRIMTTSGEIRG
jgi:hypothetical protein